MSLLAYRQRCALHSRTPSMIEAWFRASEMMASCSSSNGSKTPPLASKQAAYSSASSVPRNFEMRSSSALCRSWVPQMKRTEDRP